MIEAINELSRLRNAFIKRLIICISIAIVLSALLFIFAPTGKSFGIIILFMLCLIITYGPYNRYRKYYKSAIVTPVLKKSFDNVEYVPEEGIPHDVIADTGLIRMGNTFSGEDFIKASYKGVNFVTSDVKISQVTQTDNGPREIIYFSGRWMIFDFNKRFKKNVQIKDKAFAYSKHRKGYFSDKTVLQKIDMDSTVFNKAFKTYAVDKHDAYYIVTPHFMEKLLSMKAKTKAKLMFGFIDNQLHVAISGASDSFKVHIFRRVSEENIMKWEASFIEDIKDIIGFVEELNLDHTLFMPDDIEASEE